MQWQFWIIQTLNSVAFGGLLFLLSSGFSLIFGLMRIPNLAHGAFFMLGAYFGYTLLAWDSNTVVTLTWSKLGLINILGLPDFSFLRNFWFVAIVAGLGVGL